MPRFFYCGLIKQFPIFYNKRGNILLKRNNGYVFAEPLLLWKDNNYYLFQLFFCSLSFRACNAHALIILSSMTCLPLPHFSRQVGFTLSQATKALRESRGIALLYFRSLHQKGVRGQRHDPAAPYRRERPSTHFTGGWLGLRAGLDR